MYQSLTFISGDIAFRFLKYTQPSDEISIGDDFNLDDLSAKAFDIPSGFEDEPEETLEKPQTHVTVFDINQEMLNVGKERALENGIFEGEIYNQ